jgi:hypothetical protein
VAAPAKAATPSKKASAHKLSPKKVWKSIAKKKKKSTQAQQ